MRFVYEDDGQKHQFELRQGEVRIGRDPSCEIATTNRSVSRKHVHILVKGTTVMVRDENSGNGMFVNDVRMPEAVLKNGDVLRAGKFALTFQAEEDDRTIVSSTGNDQEGTAVNAASAAPPPPRRKPSPAQEEAAGHKTAPLDDVRDELAKVAAAPPPQRKSKPVAAEPAPPGRLKVVKGMPASVRDLKGRTTLGTQDDSGLVLTGDGISRSHAEVVVKDGKWVVRDLASRNGTWVNGKKVEEHVLADGDTIQIGSVGLTFVGGGSSPAAPAAKEAAAAPPPPKKQAPPEGAPAAAAKRKRLLIIGGAAIGLILIIGILTNLPSPEEGGGGGPGKGGGAQPSAAGFEEAANEAWGGVYEAMQTREYKGAASALTPVEKVYKKYGQDDAELKAWRKVIEAFIDAGTNCSNLNGEGWDNLKALLLKAPADGFLGEFARNRAEWCDRRKTSWQEVSQAQEAASAGQWADAVAHYKAVPDNDSCYAELAKNELKAAIEQWKKTYVEKLNKLEASADFEQCVATYNRMVKDLPDTKGDKKLYGRFEKWNDNVESSKHVRAASQLVDQGKYEDALKELSLAHTNDENLTAEIQRLRTMAESGGTVSEVNQLYKQGKADEALARLGDAAEGSPLAVLKQKITKVYNAWKDARAAEDRKDYPTAKRWWTEILSNEADKDNFYVIEAQRGAGFDPTAKAQDFAGQASDKATAGDYAAARTLAEEALKWVPGYGPAQKLVDSIVDEASHRYNILYAKWRGMDKQEALKEAEGIKAMLRASDTKEWRRVNGFIEQIKKEIDGGGK